MENAIPISLRYDGPDVAAGEMDIGEVISALQGFSGAYAKAASEIAPNADHQLKITAIREGSFDLLIAAAICISQSGGFETIKSLTEAAKATFEVVKGVIALKKHTEGKVFETRVNGNSNNVTIVNVNKLEMSMPLEVFKMFSSKKIDSDLSKIVAPLNEGHIDFAELKEDGTDDSKIRIDSTEKEYFAQSSGTTQKECEVAGTLVSLNKKTNRGTFEFVNGSTARYLFVGGDKDHFHRDFSVKGQVRVKANVTFDENLSPIHLDIENVQRVQLSLEITGDSD